MGNLRSPKWSTSTSLGALTWLAGGEQLLGVPRLLSAMLMDQAYPSAARIRPTARSNPPLPSAWCGEWIQKAATGKHGKTELPAVQSITAQRQKKSPMKNRT